MSHASFYSERHVAKTRRARQCCECLHALDVGVSCKRIVGVHEGDFSCVYAHSDCLDAAREYNAGIGTYGDTWYSLHEIDEVEDFRWLCDTFPAVADRMGVTPLVMQARLSGLLT